MTICNPSKVAEVDRLMPPNKKGRIWVLECLRGLAATYVLIHHMGNYFGIATKRWFLPFAFGQDAVLVFFLLSGFVIGMTTSSFRIVGFREYFIKRFRRIYPIFIAALLLSYFAISYRNGSWQPVQWDMLVGNLLMLQDFQGVRPGSFFDTYYGTTPLWSLAYEWWFYMMFYPCYRYIPKNLQLPSVLVISLTGVITYAAIPNGVSLYMTWFAIWWTGVEMAREYTTTGKLTIRQQSRPLAGLFMLAVAWCLTIFVIMGQHWTSIGATPVVQPRYFIDAIVIVVIGIIWRNQFNLCFFKYLVGPFFIMAPISYAMYAIHWPVLMTSNLFYNELREPYRILSLVVIILVLAYLLEVRMQSFINRITDPLCRRKK